MIIGGRMPRDLTRCPQCGVVCYMGEAQVVCDSCNKQNKRVERQMFGVEGLKVNS